MLTLPWTTTGSGPVVGGPTMLAGRLPFGSLRQLWHAVAWAVRIQRQLARTNGLAGYSLAIDLRGRSVWTVSAWTSRTSLNDFDHGQLHQRAKSALRPRMRSSTFVMWTGPATGAKVSWAEIRSRIAAAAVPSHPVPAHQFR